jgi:hypothetical protein
MAALEADHARAAGVREQAFAALRDAMPAANLAAALRCSGRLHDALPHRGRLDHNLVLVAFGGGKDSAYTVAFVRAMQLILHRVHGTTFRMRVATMRHAGMPRAVLENIHREYETLRLYGDPDCELLLIDGDEVSRFDVDSRQPEQMVRRNRLDILMTGHRTSGDGRPTFCNACNLSVANSFGLAASYGSGADLIITGDSKQEQRQYTRWIGQLARRLDAVEDGTQSTGIGRTLSRLDAIAQSYFRDIYGPDAPEAVAERRVAAGVPDRLQFFSIYSDTHYAADDHLELLTGFLGFRFDDIAFSFTESDCGNPALMAHLRGLRCERPYQRTYAEGMREYVEFALDLMRKKDIPEHLVAKMRDRYEGPEAIPRMRRAADEYASTTFGLTEEQLVCMVYAPFTGKGAGLDQFIEREHPELAGRLDEIHALLADQAPPNVGDIVGKQGPHTNNVPDIGAILTRISGLELSLLRSLYRSSGLQVIDAVLAGDPHKAVIPTRHDPHGPQVFEQISGR